MLILIRAERIPKSIFTSAKDVVDEPMLQIDSLEDDVFKRASIVSQECGNSMAEKLLEIMKQNTMNSPRISIAERRTRLSARINGIHTQDILETALNCHHLGTCNWALQLDVFKEWAADDAVLPKLLWIHGPPGFGKTILSAWIIQHLRAVCNDPVSYFFCVADNELTRDPYAALRSWLVQIVEKDATVDIMEGVISGRKRDGPLTRSELWELFVAVGQVYPGLCFIMDGFDECTNIGLTAGYHKDDPRNMFLRDLVHYLPEAQARVLLVSRDVADIREYLGADNVQEVGVRKMEYQITSNDTAADVTAYSVHVVNQKLSKKPEKLRWEIATQAASRSQGMFLWIQLLEKEISSGDNAKELRKIVREMPSGISQAYARELDKIDRLNERDRRQAIMILRWVLFAVRPLQIKELAEALVVSDYEDQSYPRDDLPDEWEDCFVNEEYVKTKILGLGGSLLRLRSESPDSSLASHTVHFVHFSVKEYLTSNVTEDSWAAKLSLSDPSTETNTLSRICLHYLTMDVFDKIPTDTRLYPFLSYASWAWYFHGFHQKPPPCGDIMDSTKRAFDPCSASWKVWTPLMEQRLIGPAHTRLRRWWEEDSISNRSRSQPRSSSKAEDSNYDTFDKEQVLSEIEDHGGGDHLENPVYYASLLGLTDIVDWLVGQGLRVDCAGGRFGFPLQAASARGHLETVDHLLNHGAPVDQVGGEFRTALIGAAACATLAIVRRLLDANADITLADEVGFTALDYAAKRGARDIVKRLTRHGAQPTATTRRLDRHFERDTLHVLMVGQNSFSPDQNLEDIQALDHAMRYAHFNVVIDIIESLPAPMIRAPLKNGYTLLHAAAAHGALPVVHRLLHHPDQQRRAEVNRAEPGGWSALHEACAQGHDQVVRALLKADANVSQEELDVTPLQAAASQSHCKIIETLIEHGAELDKKTRGNVTALRIAVEVGSLEAVELLLNLGASMSGIDEKSSRQHTLYETACFHGDYKIADLLLSRGCFGAVENSDDDVNRRITVLASRAMEDEAVKDVQSALSRHPRPSENILGETLCVAALSGHSNLVRLLLDLGAPFNSRDINGRTALHYAAFHRHEQLCEILLNAGASIAIEDNNGSNPIDLAMCNGSRMVSFINGHQADLRKQITRRPSLLAASPSDGLETKPASPFSVRQALTGHWEGTYEYLSWRESQKEPWAVSFPEISKTGNVHDCTKPNVLTEEKLTFSSSGTDEEVGDFALNGFVDSLGLVWFVKLYERHGWLYKGQLSADMKQMRGTWGGNRKLWYGTFVLSLTSTGELCR